MSPYFIIPFRIGWAFIKIQDARYEVYRRSAQGFSLILTTHDRQAALTERARA